MIFLNKHKDDPTGAVYIGRGSPLGNPYVIGQHGTREEVIEKYGPYLRQRLIQRDLAIEKALRSLTEHSRLLCFCHPRPCHGGWINYYHQKLVNDQPYEDNLKRLMEEEQTVSEPLSPVYRPETEGVDHINVYSKSRTDLGRLLSNFHHRPFTHYQHGDFASVEAYWYWLGTGKKHEHLRPLSGYAAKLKGKDLARCPVENFESHIKKALLSSIEQNENVRTLLKDSHLPLTHYYVYGHGETAKIHPLPQHKWITDFLMEIREYLNGHRYKLLVAGPRLFDEGYEEKIHSMIQSSLYRPIEIVTGMARGVDTHALNYAKKHKLSWQEFPVTKEEWDQYGKSAGHRRNHVMGIYCDAASIAWDGKSRGTSNMIDVMKSLNKPFDVTLFSN